MTLRTAFLIAATALLFSATTAVLVGSQAAMVVDRQMDAVRQVSTTLDNAFKGN
jgi:hypothetical protein